MQFKITDAAAIQFAQEFYQYVAKRRPIDDSVMRARRALRRAKKNSLEWGTLVLYLRSPNGRMIFGSTNQPPTPAPQKLTNPTPASYRVSHHLNSVQILRHRNSVHELTFVSDGRRLATADTDYWETRYTGDRSQQTVRIWDVTQGRELLRIVHKQDSAEKSHPWFGLQMAFSPDGSRLATTAPLSHTVRIWDATNGEELARVTHDSIVDDAAFSPDARRLATASKDKTVRIWDSSGAEFITITHDSDALRVVFSPDGQRLTTAWTNGIGIWMPRPGNSSACLLAVTTHEKQYSVRMVIAW